MSMPNKVKDAKGDNANTPTSKSTKVSEIKENQKSVDRVKPTAEQIRIAQIINSRSEDPSIRDKIKHVMDATQKSEDEVCTALYDCDNDPNRAVNILLEEGRQSEWSTLKKKKKPKQENKVKEVQNQNSNKENISRSANKEESNMWEQTNLKENESGSGNTTHVNHSESRGGRGRGGNKLGRGGSWRGGRDRSDSDFRSHNDNFERGERNFRGRGSFQRGHGRGRGERRGRGGGGSTFYQRSSNPSNSWNSQINSTIQDSSNSLEDWDNEEYTGSLSVVFTPSSTADVIRSEPQVQPEPPQMNSLVSSVPDNINNQTMSASTRQFLSHFATSKSTVPPTSNSLFRNGAMSANVQGNQSFGTYSEITELNTSQMKETIPISHQRQNPPTPAKITNAVEMPPNVGNSGMTLVDVQFGALDLGDNNDNIQTSNPPSPQSSPNKVEQVNKAPTISESEPLLINDSRSFSPVRSTAPTSLSHISDVVKTETSAPNLYQDNSYQPSFLKSHHQSSVPNSYTAHYGSSAATVSTTAKFSSTTSSSYSTSNVVSAHANSSNSYNPTLQYPSSYQSSSSVLNTTMPLHLQNTYQTGNTNQYLPVSTQQSMYGSTTTNSFSSTQYSSFSNSGSTHNHKSSALTYTTPSNREFDSSSQSGTLNSMAHSSNVHSVPASLLSSQTQTTATTKPSVMSTMGKSTVVQANVPPGVAPLVGTQYIVSQPYFTQQPLYASYEDLQLMPPQRLPPTLATEYFDVGYPTATTRENVSYNMNDANRYSAPRNDDPSPVQGTTNLSSNTQPQSGTQGNQQALINPALGPPTYAYFYGGSMLPGNFQYAGAPSLHYPVAATGTGSGHGSTSLYGKSLNTYTGGYGATYEGGQGSVDYKSATTQGTKTQPSHISNAPSSDLNIYSKSHAALSKVNSYDRPSGFHCATPPPFSLGSQNSPAGIGAMGGYAQQLFFPPIHNTTLQLHQPLHQDVQTGVSGLSQVSSQQNKVGGKPYNSSTYWTPNN